MDNGKSALYIDLGKLYGHLSDFLVVKLGAY